MLPSQLPTLTGQVVFYDTEGSGLYVDSGARCSTVSVAWWDRDANQIAAYAWPFDQGGLDKTPQASLFSETEQAQQLPRNEWNALLDWLSRQRLAAHNLKHDLHVMRAGTRHWPGRDLAKQGVWDTTFGCQLLWPTESVALGSTCARLKLGTKDADPIKHYLKANKLPKGRYDLAPWDIVEPYATADAVLGLRLLLRQVHDIQIGLGGPDGMGRIRVQMERLRMLYRLETRGIGFDADRSRAVAADLAKAQAEIEQELPFDPAAGVASAKRWFFGPKPGALGLSPKQTTPTGQAQLDEVVIRDLVRRQIPGAELYQRWRKIDTARSMWYEGYPALLGPDGRLRTSFKQLPEVDDRRGKSGGTVSGRLAVSRVNLQAIPHKSKLGLGMGGLPKGTPTPRQFFTAPPGYELWEIDLQQAELRGAVAVAGCDTMAKLILGGADLHGTTATQLFGTQPDDETWFEDRQVAKRANFSLGFGAGGKTFRQMLIKQADVIKPLAECEEIVRRWRALYPEFQRAIHKWDRYAERHGYVPLLNGARRWFRPGEYTHKAFNQLIQGSLAEMALDWAVATDTTYPDRLLLLIHDSQVLELQSGEASLVTAGVVRLAEEIGTTFWDFPMGADSARFGEH